MRNIFYSKCRCSNFGLPKGRIMKIRDADEILVIEGNEIYELDEECLEEKKQHKE